MLETIFLDASGHAIYQLVNAPIREYPFPHIYVKNLFPEDFYAEIMSNMPGEDDFTPILETGRVSGETQKARSVIPLNKKVVAELNPKCRDFWSGLTGLLQGQELFSALMYKFQDYLLQRFGDSWQNESLYPDILLIKDKTNYELGPHTDHDTRALVVIIYLPETEAHRNLGTSLYVPKDRQLRCQGGPHYPFDQFDRVMTADYVPNSALVFVKTDNSFHGVEPNLIDGAERRQIHLVIRREIG